MEIRLCGGIFFNLLLIYKKNDSSNCSDEQIYTKLLEFTRSTSLMCTPKTLQTHASNLKNCKPFQPFQKTETESQRKQNFDYSIKNNYVSTEEKFNIFINNCIDISKQETLVNYLLRFINEDATICNEDRFFVNPNGLTKQELLNSKNLLLSSFLLGVWHYIVMHIPDNTVGQATFAALIEEDSKCAHRVKRINLTKLNNLLKPIETPTITSHIVSCSTTQKSLSSKLYYKSTKCMQNANLTSEDLQNMNNVSSFTSSNLGDSNIFFLRTEYEISSDWTPKRQILVRFNFNNISYCGCTSIENWVSRSLINNIISASPITCNAWFQLIDSKKNIVQFLMIGD